MLTASITTVDLVWAGGIAVVVYGVVAVGLNLGFDGVARARGSELRWDEFVKAQGTGARVFRWSMYSLFLLVFALTFYTTLGSISGEYKPLLGGVSFLERGVVKWTAPDESCSTSTGESEIVLDRETGRPLTCYGGRLTGPFSNGEANQIVDMAQALASDGDGLTDSDREAVGDFAKDVRREGYLPSPLRE